MRGGMIYGEGYYYFFFIYENKNGEYEPALILASEETGDIWHLSSSQSDDILYCSSMNFRTTSTTGEMVSFVNAISFIEALPQIKENKVFNYSPKLIEQIENMTVEDNPVMVLYTLK